MKNDKLRVSIDEPYLQALGLAIVCFARLEWGSVWCCERMAPGYVSGVGRKTAGQIAIDLRDLTAAHPNLTSVTDLTPAAAEFRRLVTRRNDLVHANPEG